MLVLYKSFTVTFENINLLIIEDLCITSFQISDINNQILKKKIIWLSHEAEFDIKSCCLYFRLFNSEKYARQELTVIRSDWIKDAVKVGNRRSSEVPLGEYILAHPSIAEGLFKRLMH